MRNVMILSVVSLLMSFLLAASAGISASLPVLYVRNEALILPAALLYAGNILAVCHLHSWMWRNIKIDA